MNTDLHEISDGKIYTLHDMVRAAGGCAGCHACCEKMGTSIILDPLDIFLLTKNRDMTLDQMIDESIELNVSEGLILPNLKMAGEKECCAFLKEDGRCRIHPFRPGLCRVFPLGRMYDEDRLDYFLQKDACRREGRSKTKVSKWLDMPELRKNQQFLTDWHRLKKELEAAVLEMKEETAVRTLNLFVLKTFYLTPYDRTKDFYQQFYERLTQTKKVLLLSESVGET